MCIQDGACWSLHRYTTMTFALVHIPGRERVFLMIFVILRTGGLWVWGGTVTDSCPWESSSALSFWFLTPHLGVRTMAFGGTGKWWQVLLRREDFFPLPFPHPQSLDLPGWWVGIQGLDWAGPWRCSFAAQVRDGRLSGLTLAGELSCWSFHLLCLSISKAGGSCSLLHKYWVYTPTDTHPRTDTNPPHSCMDGARSSNVWTHQKK